MVPPATKMPPPDANLPHGATADALLPVTRELSSVSVALRLSAIPPPFDCTAAARLSLTVESAISIVPQLSSP